MHTYTPKTFDLPSLEGISDDQIQVHLGLYEGYVKHVNHLRQQIHDLKAEDAEKYAYAITETRRRLGFEFNGMRMHEYYFTQFEGGAKDADPSSSLVKTVSEKYGSWEEFISHFTEVGMSRGIGWTVLYQDVDLPAATMAQAGGGTVHTAWVTDHELGQLGGQNIILAMDMWEHAFMVDYKPAEKKAYIEAFLKNLNWGVCEERMK